MSSFGAVVFSEIEVTGPSGTEDHITKNVPNCEFKKETVVVLNYYYSTIFFVLQ